MSNGVEFDADNMQYTMRRQVPGASGFAGGDTNQPKMVQWLIRKGIVKTPNVAQVVLVGVIIVNIIITFVVVTFLL